MSFNKFLQYKALGRIYGVNDPDFLMKLMSDQHPDFEKENLKNVCALIHVSLFEKLETTCSFLDISKRRFIEGAIIDALINADRIIKDEGVFQEGEVLISSSTGE